jgi:uncharacterized protein HemX
LQRWKAGSRFLRVRWSLKVAEIFRMTRMSRTSIAKAQRRLAQIVHAEVIAHRGEIAADAVDVQVVAEVEVDAAGVAVVTAAEAVDGMVVADTAGDATKTPATNFAT